jgi:hypothetical protein
MTDKQVDCFGGGGSVKGGYFGDPGRGPDGERCGTCGHCIGIRGNTKNYYKCGLLKPTSGEGTDIRLKTAACQHWLRNRPQK